MFVLQGGKGLHSTLNFHSKKFVGILNGIDTDAWNPATDTFLKVQYNANDLQGKAENKVALRRHLALSFADARQPLVMFIFWKYQLIGASHFPSSYYYFSSGFNFGATLQLILLDIVNALLLQLLLLKITKKII